MLEGFQTPLAKSLQRYRAATKRANTYFANYLYFADEHDRIHPNMRQAGTDTGRFSFSDPNLQNVPTEDTGAFPVRRAFVPAPGFFFAMLDYDQQEFRLLLDYAGELGLIRRIVDEGLDVHQAAADQMGVTRPEAKTLNFGLLYGMGADKLAAALGITTGAATILKSNYFEALPKVRDFTQGVTQRANTRGYIYNWAGRVCHFPWVMNPRTGKMDRFAYKACNHLIQGGCGDVMKIALNRCDDYLAGKKSRLLLTVHDEVLLEVSFDECYVVAGVKKILDGAYPHRHLPMTSSASYSLVSWADKEVIPSAALTENWAPALSKATSRKPMTRGADSVNAV